MRLFVLNYPFYTLLYNVHIRVQLHACTQKHRQTDTRGQACITTGGQKLDCLACRRRGNHDGVGSSSDREEKRGEHADFGLPEELK